MRGQAPSRLLAGLLIAAAVAAVRADGGAGRDDAFINWGGESYEGGSGGGRQGRGWVETISWEPRAFIWHGFLSEAEADHIVALVEDKVLPSSVINTQTGASEKDPIRTSYGGSIVYGQTRTIAAIEQRIADWTQLPPSHQEPMQVLRYMDGQQYNTHYDWFDHPGHFANETTENRAATVLMYLADGVEGGETALPLAEPIDEDRQAHGESASACARNGTLAVTPVKGDVLLFWDILPDGTTVDRLSLHASCPTTKGTKWTATKWIHNRPYNPSFDPLERAALCVDEHAECPQWAKEGKCDSDPVGMLGPGGKCRRSCEDCTDCAANDIICLRKNMRSLRYMGAGAAPSSGGTEGRNEL